MQRPIASARKRNMLMRACPRCGGDLYRDMLEVDEEFVCLQCGRRAEPRAPGPSEPQARYRSIA